MAPKGTKRPAAAASGDAKRAKTISVSAMCNRISGALLEAEVLDKTVRTMLSGTAPFALSEYVEDRHEYHVKVLTMVEDAMSAIQAKFQKDVDDLKAKIDGRDADIVAREEAVIKSAQAIAEAKSTAANKEYTHYEAVTVYNKADAALKEAEKIEKAEGKTHIALAKKKQRLQSIKEKVDVMKSGSCPKKDVVALEKEMTPFGLDATLLSHMHLCLTKPSADLSEFETRMMTELDAELGKRAAEIDGDIAKEEPSQKARADAVAVASTKAQAAKQALDVAKAEWSDAKKQVTAAEGELKAKEASVRGFEGEMAQAVKQLAKAEAALQDFVTGTFGAFTTLKERVKPPPEPEAAEQEVPPPAEEAAAEKAADEKAADEKAADEKAADETAPADEKAPAEETAPAKPADGE